MAATDSVTRTPGSARSRLGLILLACCVGQFMVVLDASIVNVALRPIQDALGFSASTLQWVINAYTIIFAGFLLLGGRLADLFGRRRIFALGLALFTAAGLVAGLAWNPESLLIARGIQGLGGAVLAPATLTVLFTSFTDPAGKVKAFGTWSAVAAGGGAIGALVGGVVTEWLSWRWIFLVNVPIGVALMVLVLAVVPESRAERADRRIDAIGAVAVTGGLMAIVLGIVESQDKGWDSTVTVGSLVAGVLLVAFFLLNVVSFTTSAALVGVLFLFTLLMQFVYGYDSLETGLAYLPLSLAIVTTARGLAPQLITKLGPKPVLVAGSTLSLAALIWLSFVTTDGGFVHDLLGPSLLFGAGQGFVSATVTMAGTANVPYTQAGLVSGLLNASRQVGGALWLSILAAVVAGHADSLTAGASADGYRVAFLVATAFPLIGILAGLAVPGVSPAALAAAKNWGAKKSTDSGSTDSDGADSGSGGWGSEDSAGR
ncbi:MFS transporter [Streptomyces sp. NPDC005811]|uniref:MFS transporter n=1 Tax=Streptomyces sp. NPDC005811 TaxID=3154565 RepID=UPI0033F75CDF